MRFSLDWLRDFVGVDLPPAELAVRLTTAGLEVAAWEVTGAAAEADTIFEIDITANRPDTMNHLGLAREIAALLSLPLKLPSLSLTEDPAPAAGAASVTIEAGELCPRYVGRVVVGLRVAESPAWLKRRLSAIGLTPKNNLVDASNYVLYELGQPLHAFDLERLAGRGVRVRRSSEGETIVTVADRIERRLAEGVLLIAEAGAAGKAGRPAAIAGVMGGLATAISDATTQVLIESAWFDPVSVRRTARAMGIHSDASHRFERGADPGMTLFAADRLAVLIAELGGGRILSGVLDVRAGAAPRSSGPIDGSDEAIARKGPPAGSSGTAPRAGEGPKVSTITLKTAWRSEPVLLRTAAVSELLGLETDPAAFSHALARLGIERAPSASVGSDRAVMAWQAYSIPTWRGDIVREVDLIEEYARLGGYDKIPETLPRIEMPAGRPATSEREDRARACLASAGYREAITYATISSEDDALFGPMPPGSTPLRIENPLSDRWVIMRRSLLPGLARALVFNIARGCDNLNLFEVGTVHHRGGAEGRVEIRMAAIGSAGLASGPEWPASARPYDALDLKGTLESLIESLSGHEVPRRKQLVFTRPSDPRAGHGPQAPADPGSSPAARTGSVWPFHPGLSFEVSLDGKTLGRGGRVHPDIERAVESDRPLFLAEIALDPFLTPPPPARYEALARLNPVDRDLSFLVERGVPYADIACEVRAAVGALSSPLATEESGAISFMLIDRFEGGALPANRISFAFRFRFSPRERALTTEELNGAIERVAEHLVRTLRAEIRSR